MFISYSEVSIKNPDNSGQALLLTYVCCREQAEDCACWHLLTSEKVVVHVWNRCECRPGITLSA